VDNPRDIQALVFGEFIRNNKRRFWHDCFICAFHSFEPAVLFPVPAVLWIVALIRFIASAWDTVLPATTSDIPRLMARIVCSSVSICRWFSMGTFLNLGVGHVELGN
jgi:hypothetical protein